MTDATSSASSVDAGNSNATDGDDGGPLDASDAGPSAVISVDVPDSPGTAFGPSGVFAPTSLLIGDASVSRLRVADLRVRPSGEVVALLGDPLSGCTSYCQTDDVLVQLRSGGATLDRNFGSGGIVKLPMASFDGNGVVIGDGGTSVNLTIFSTPQGGQILLQPDGKVLVLGTCEASLLVPGDHFYACVERFDADGTLDDKFGFHGVSVVYEPGFAVSHAVAMALDGTGGIIVLVEVGDQAGISRLAADGTIDPTFAKHGMAVLDRAGIPRALALQSEESRGRILVLTKGTVGPATPPNGTSMVVSALTATGIADNSFASGLGSFAVDFFDTFVTTPTAYPADIPMSLVVTEGDAIFVLGTAGLSDSSVPDEEWKRSAGVAKLTRNGALDTTFGAGGRVRVATSNDDSLGAWSLVPFESDLLVAASATRWSETTWAMPLLLQLRADGSLDRSHAPGGVLRLPFALSLVDTVTYPFPSSAQYALAAGDGAVYVGAETFVDGGAHGVVIAEPP